ncbi:polymorphic toxin-type HINT domain-containing protein [Amycolatopsis sp. NPDC058340]|uniref:polymorphic toxin-type HINT domain-containing protein n=1 Tax=Amycolatopsis sp. NPDC058340 TaxID=3346453 RepID=UPI0036547C69
MSRPREPHRIPWGKILKIGEIVASSWKGARALATFGREVEKAQKVIADTERILADAEMAANAVQVVVAVSEGEGVVGAAAAAMGGAAAASDSGCNSFVPGTQVLMADGTTKPIEEVKLDDQVQATDPETGETTARKVVATIIGQGQKRLVEIGIAGGAPIVATDGHPFWAPGLRAWVPANGLTVGSWLQTSSGTWAQVTAVHSFDAVASVHNLTVDDLHTYSALAGATPVLVHNCGGSQPGHSDLCRCDPGKPRSEVVVDRGLIRTGQEPSPGHHRAHRYRFVAAAAGDDGVCGRHLR